MEKGTPRSRACSASQNSLRGELMATKRMWGSDGPHELADLGALLVLEVAVVVAGDDEARVALAEAADRGLQHLLLRAQDVDAVATLLRQPEQPEHEVDAGHALGERVAEEARGPDDRLSVDADELAALDDVAQPRVVLERDDLGDVDRDVLRRLAGVDDLRAALDGRLHVETVDLAAEDPRPVAWPRRSHRSFQRAAPAHAARRDPRVEGRRDGGREDVGDPLGGLAVPQRDRAGRVRSSCRIDVGDRLRVVADERVRALE